MVLQQLSTQYEDIHFVKNLGKFRYYSMMKYADIMLGNSSSGIIEAQSYHLPVINVGLRQEGRLRNKNVYDVNVDVDLILNAIEEVQQNSFKKIYMNETNIYGDGHSCEKIVSFIKATDFSKLLYKKSIFE